MNVKVTSVSGTAQTLSRTAAAVFVITAEDIQRSGSTNIPDLLRMVPGMNVAQINANTWAISARGFNGRFSNELLVTVDGRNVYTPTFGGVFWDVLDMPLEDIERIEVIRGPGATVWGTNAVNGVVNIITKRAGNTHGGMVVAGGGTLNQGFGTVQYGSSLGKSTDFRLSAKYFNQDHLPSLELTDGHDGWHMLRADFRADSSLTPKDALTIEGAIYKGSEGNPTEILPSVTSPELQPFTSQVGVSGGTLQTVWSHTYSPHSDSTLQLSFDRYIRNDVLSEQRNTFAANFQHHFAWGSRQDIVWGAGFRYTDSATHGDLIVSLNPADLTMKTVSSFIQDEVAVIPAKLYVSAGIKLEHNYYTGVNWMPSVRFSWTPMPKQMFWAAVSKAARTPSELDTAIRLNFAGFPGPGGVPALAALVGNPDFRDEGLIALEFGYRTTLSDHLSLDVALYRNHYYNQQTTEPATPFFESTPSPAHLVVPLTYKNLSSAVTYGVEISGTWRITDRWTLSPGYAFEGLKKHLDPTSQDDEILLESEGTPAHSAQVQSHFNLARSLGWDASVSFVDRLAGEGVPSYTRVDTGLVYRWTEGLSVSLIGQNLLKDHHLEFLDASGSTRSTLIKRSVYAKFTWQF